MGLVSCYDQTSRYQFTHGATINFTKQIIVNFEPDMLFSSENLKMDFRYLAAHLICNRLFHPTNCV